MGEIVNETTEEDAEYLETGRDVLAYYADRGFTVEEIVVEHPTMADRPNRAEVTVELTLAEPVSSVLDRMEGECDEPPFEIDVE